MLLCTQNPNPFEAFEGTTGNIGFVNCGNRDTATATTATITGITARGVRPAGGEVDDQATNLALIGPNPTVANPLLLVPGGNFNIKFSWDAVDDIKDNDVDFGLWDAFFDLALPHWRSVRHCEPSRERRPASCHSPTLRHRPRRIGSARLEKEAKGESSRLIKKPDRNRRYRLEASIYALVQSRFFNQGCCTVPAH